MGADSNIDWTDSTWNWLVGCTEMSGGCQNCYAEKLIGTRFSKNPVFGDIYEGLTRDTPLGPRWTGKIELIVHRVLEPFGWKEPRKIFLSLTDVFHPNLPKEAVQLLFGVIALTRRHTYQILTKRAERMASMLCEKDFWLGIPAAVAAFALQQKFDLRFWKLAHDVAKIDWETIAKPATCFLPNVWLGVSAEDQVTANERIPHLLKCPAKTRFVSAEPLIGPIDLSRIPDGRGFTFDARSKKEGISLGGVGLDLLIVGGESAPASKRREMDVEWAISLRRQCEAAGVKFFFKQKSSTRSGHDPYLPDDKGEPRMYRELP